MPNYHSLSAEIEERIREDRAKHIVNPYACQDSDIVRRHAGHDTPRLWRPAFVMDVEKIMHNSYYNRYSDKTQVISCFRNDDISHRALHVQIVSRIARTIGTALGLNLDLIEAISLGHDIGHTPFGHAGEHILNDLYHANTGRFFNHNVHSVRVLNHLVQRNISLQVLDGVICHNGEMEQQEYRPKAMSDFFTFDQNVESCYTDNESNKRQIPCTLEGCVMRISDIIAYLGKDRQDAERIGLIDEKYKFSGNTSIGTTNPEIINNMTVSIIEHSYGKPYLSMDKDAFEAFSRAKKENYSHIYGNPIINDIYENNVRPMFQLLYEELLNQAMRKDENSILYKHHIQHLRNENMYQRYIPVDDFIAQYLQEDPNEIVTDFMASMTDDYFIDLFQKLFPDSPYHVSYVEYFE